MQKFNLKNKIILTIMLFLLLSPLLNVSIVSAQGVVDVNQLANPIGGTFDVSKMTDEKAKQDARRGNTDINLIIKKVIDIALNILGSATLLVFVVGGFMWLTSGGNEQRVQKGTKTMLYATIGIFVIFSAYAILSALFGVLTGGK
ncbi:MAG: pilin [bacterium]|nr:pilin [bacterium]